MGEKATSNESTGEKAMGDEPTGRAMDLAPVDSSLVNSLLRYWLPTVLWMGVIFILSAQPALLEYPDSLLDLILKKAAHVMEYGLLAFLLWRAFSRGRAALSRPAWVTALVVSVLYAVSDEYHQTFVPGRHGRLMDVGIDAVGVLLALLVVGRLIRRKATER